MGMVQDEGRVQVRRASRQDPDYGDYLRDQQKDDRMRADWALKKVCPTCDAQPDHPCKFADADNDAELFGFHPRRVP